MIRQIMKINDVLKYFYDPDLDKSPIDCMACALDINRANVYLWKQRGGIPFIQQLRIERISKGILKAEDPKNRLPSVDE